MAFVALPQTWFENMVDSNTDVNIPLATFPELTAAEIDASTGDIRKMLYAIIEKCWTRWNALATADRSTKMVLTKSSSSDPTTGVITHVYTFTFKNTISGQEVASES